MVLFVVFNFGVRRVSVQRCVSVGCLVWFCWSCLLLVFVACQCMPYLARLPLAVCSFDILTSIAVYAPPDACSYDIYTT